MIVKRLQQCFQLEPCFLSLRHYNKGVKIEEAMDFERDLYLNDEGGSDPRFRR